uniref:MAM domain-containing protein n=1 Tax=Tetranychus urticae TaxID=32264 RepID=T1KBR3_TETUR
MTILFVNIISPRATCSISTDIDTLQCHFTDGFCNWLNQDEKWKLGDYTNVTFGRPVRPLVKGGYVYVSDGPNLNGYQILSPILDQDVEPFCLSFNYYMFGPDVGQLTLRLIDDNGSGNQWVEVDNDVWNRKGSQDDDWFTGRYHFTSKRKTKVRLAFVATSSNIALGPIKANPGSCDYSNLCNFEDISVCFWFIEPDYSSNFAWYISDGKSSEGSFIFKDATTQSESGKFLRTPNDGAIDSKSLLTTKVVLNSDEAKCMSFNLFKPNKDSDLVEINLVNNQSATRYIWTSASIKPNSNWQPVRISLLEDGDFNIFISAHKHSNGNDTAVAIDDIQINPQSCKNLIDCSFDDTNCALSITSGPLLIGFGRLSNAESLNYTMDSFKDNDPNDFFIYTDIPTTNQSITYSFSTPAVPSTDLACLSFLYFMEPIDSFANYLFEVNVQSSSGYNLLKYEPQVTFAKWTSAEFILSTIELYQIEFSLTTESRLFAAFDDIKLVEGQCGKQHLDEHPSPKIYRKDSFDDLSNWSTWYTWKVGVYNSTGVYDSGLPTADPFGERNGKYLALTNTGTPVTAELHSPYYESGFYCLSIWYWCYTEDYAHLFVVLTSENNKSVPIINALCDKQKHWKLLEATFSMKEKFKLQLIGEVKMGDIALDEMTIFNGPCYHDQVIDETCTFDDGTDCGIDVVASPYYNWKIESGFQLSTPMVDKSTATLNGKALTLDLSPVPQINSTSYFFLANLVKEDSYCISFSYYIEGDCHLDIWKTERGNIEDLSGPLVTYDNKFESTWTKVTFQIDGVTKESDIVFGGTYSSGSTGLLAVDDLTISLGECISSVLCDFDSTCNWDNLPIGTTIPVDELGISYVVTTRWQINPASIAVALGYPRKDHTYGSSNNLDGSYGYALIASIEKAILASPVIYLDASETICLRLAYVAEYPGSIEVLVEQRENEAYIFKNLQSYGSQSWKYVDLTIPLRKSQTRMAKVYVVSSSAGRSAIDDVLVTKGSCPISTEFFTCSDGTKLPQTSRCDYIKDCQKGEDEQNCGRQAAWGIRNSNIALDKNQIGITTTGSLVSPLIQRTSSSCHLTFSYSKPQSDHLDVSLLMNSREIQLWKSDLIDEKTDWNIVSIELGRIQSPFQVLFTGITTFRVFEYQKLSIDYVRFVNCGYETIESKDPDLFSCSNGQKIASNRVCDASFDCEMGEDEENCDNQVFSFEHNELFPWFNAANVSNSKYEWIVTTGVGTISLKPTLDHTRRLPSGSYAFLYEKNDQHNSKSINSLMGPELIKTEGCKISFYYYLSSKSPNSSQINIYASNSDDKVLLETVNDLSDFGFKRVMIALDSVIKPPYRVSIEGVLDSNKESSLIAIDDISFNSACYGKSKSKPSPIPQPGPEPDKNCKGNEFYCEADKKCIDIENTCDYINDCSDGADEKNCGSCDFVDGLCGWRNEGSNLWLPINRSTAEQEGFPNQISNPSTFLIATSSPSGGSVAIRSPLLGKTSSICLFKFKYHLSDQTKLSVRKRQENSLVSKTIVELLHDGPDSSEWVDDQLELNSLDYIQFIQFVLDSRPSDRFFLSTGLSNFNLLYCVNFDAFNCNFDTNTCGWTDAGSKDLSWKLITNTSFTGDEKTKFGFGKYSNQEHPSFINLDINHDHEVNLIRTLTSPWQYATDVFCFSFDYRLLAFAETDLSLVIETPGGIMRTLFMKNSQPNYGWNQAKVTIKNVYEFRLTFKVEMGSNAGDNVISLDNFKLSTESCAFHQASCDFSTGTCDWVNEGWTIVQKQIVQSADGQTRNYYLRNTGNKGAKLTLNSFDEAESSRCLSFWYSHTFNVSSELQINSLKGDKIVSSEIVPYHELANVWSYYASSVMIKKDYKISIGAKPLGTFDSVYLDDITLYNEPCDNPGNCDFDFDSCGWQNINNAKWRRNIGVTPSTDNSLADQLNFALRGWFLFVRMNELVHGNLATLESIRLIQTPPVCLTFNYLFTSGQSNEAKITIKSVDLQKDSTSRIDEIVDDGTIEWMNFEKTIRSGYAFKILLIASARTNASGDIAIDDIKFTPGKCANDIETTTEQLTTHQTSVITEDTRHPTQPTVTPLPITIPDDTKSNSTSNHALSYLTANALLILMKQNAHIIVGIIAVVCMILLPMAFVIRHLLKPAKSYRSDTNIAMDNKVYDIYSGSGHSSTNDEMYENIDNELSSSLQFEMKKIAESEGL